MTTQLHLITSDDAKPWRLDSNTRATGRRGVALARLQLLRARPSVADDPLRKVS